MYETISSRDTERAFDGSLSKMKTNKTAKTVGDVARKPIFINYYPDCSYDDWPFTRNTVTYYQTSSVGSSRKLNANGMQAVSGSVKSAL